MFLNTPPPPPPPHTPQLDNSDAAVILRAIVKETNVVIAEAIGRGEASLDHVPLQVTVPLQVASEDTAAAVEDVSEAAEPEIIQSPVIIEAVLDETRYDVPVALRSLRPYHYSAGQEGDVPDSYLRWTCRTISAFGVKLDRDQTQEEKEKAIREEWELNQEGRAERARAKRTRYIFLKNKDTAPAPATEDAADVPAEDAANVAGDAEEGNLSAGPPDGMDGMDDEEKRVETERRAKLEALPPVTLRGHLMLPIPDTSKPASPRSKKKKKAAKSTKPRFVKRPGKYFTAQLTTAAEAAVDGAAVRSKFLTGMLVEQGRRRLAADRQLQTLRQSREKKMARLKKNLDERQALLFPEIVEVAEE